MTTQSNVRGVHFVGSAPYPSSEETFTRIAKAFPNRLSRIPDGEPGNRGYWTWWLHGIFPDWALNPLSYPAMLAVSSGEPDPGPPHWFGNMLPPPERKPGDEMIVKKPEYAGAAVESYKVFQSLKSRGVIEPNVRFQVSIPTSPAAICSHVATPYRTEADVVLEPHILAVIKEIQEAIPAKDLAIQIDLAAEMGYLENELDRSPDLWFAWFAKGTTMSELVPRLKRHIEAIHKDVEVGLHFCYGDVGHQHWAQPVDTALIVSLFNEIKKNVDRSIDFIHLPVPVDRDDDAYFEPLKKADIDPATELYLGVVREYDDEGTGRRIAAAQRVLTRPFGIATECGLGRVGESAAADSVIQICSKYAGPN